MYICHIGPKKRYWEWVYNNIQERYWNSIGPKSCSVPGNDCDKNHKGFMAFEKWHKRPIASHKLYWKLHK